MCEKRPIKINLPSIKFIKTNKNVRFDSMSHLTENNNPSIAENLDVAEIKTTIVDEPNHEVVDESTQADIYNQFQTLREQFNSTKADLNRISNRSALKI